MGGRVNGRWGRRSAFGLILLVSIGGATASRMAGAAVVFDWVTVGNPGNVPDTQIMDKGPVPDFTTGYGAVDYTYRIAREQVTNLQYVEFLNAVDPAGGNARKLYDARMTTNSLGAAYAGGIAFNATAGDGSKYSVKPGQSEYPAVWINWVSAARFVNWLANGQGGGGTEAGVYDMSLVTSAFSTPPPRSSGATIFLPSEDEWYKAAYYDPTKDGIGGYWQFGTRSDAVPASLPPPGTANSANLGSGAGSGGAANFMATTGAAFDSGVNYLTEVGAYSAARSHYGLSDLDGLVYDWTEATRTSFGNELPIYRGGSWRYPETFTGASYRNTYSGAGAASYAWYGFRVAALPAGPVADIVFDIPTGTAQTQSQAGYPLIAAADSVTKTGGGTLVFDAANGYTGPTTVSAGTLQVAHPDGVGNSNVTVATAATLSVAAGTTMKAASVIVDGGTLSASSLAVNSSTGIGSLAINAGTLAGSPSVAIGMGGQMSLVQDARVLVAIGGLAVDQSTGGGRLDLGAGQVTIAPGGISAADLRADIIAARNGGAWNGATGITSSTAAASGGTRAVGYVVAGDGSARVSFAASGDVDLSGAVNVFDLVSINSSGTYGSGAPSVWSRGDFNYDGVTNVFDLVGVNTAGAYGQGNYFPAAPTAGSLAAVPEPAGWLPLLAGLVALAPVFRRRAVA
jgi:sulfatase modifying factor 1